MFESIVRFVNSLWNPPLHRPPTDKRWLNRGPITIEDAIKLPGFAKSLEKVLNDQKLFPRILSAGHPDQSAKNIFIHINEYRAAANRGDEHTVQHLYLSRDLIYTNSDASLSKNLPQILTDSPMGVLSPKGYSLNELAVALSSEAVTSPSLKEEIKPSVEKLLTPEPEPIVEPYVYSEGKKTITLEEALKLPGLRKSLKGALSEPGEWSWGSPTVLLTICQVSDSEDGEEWRAERISGSVEGVGWINPKHGDELAVLVIDPSVPPEQNHLHPFIQLTAAVFAYHPAEESTIGENNAC